MARYKTTYQYQMEDKRRSVLKKILLVIVLLVAAAAAYVYFVAREDRPEWANRAVDRLAGGYAATVEYLSALKDKAVEEAAPAAGEAKPEGEAKGRAPIQTNTAPDAPKVRRSNMN